MNQSKAIDWSKLDPRPILWYNEKFQEWLVSWNGIQMTSEHALMIAGALLLNAPPSPEMKWCANDKFRKLYYSNAFNTEAWDCIIKDRIDIYQYYFYKLNRHITENLTNFTPSDVFSWFDKFFKRS